MIKQKQKVKFKEKITFKLNFIKYILIYKKNVTKW